MNASGKDCIRPNSCPRMAPAVIPVPVRVSKSSNVVVITPCLLTLAKVAPENPAKAVALVTPGVSKAMSVACFMIASVRSSAAGLHLGGCAKASDKYVVFHNGLRDMFRRGDGRWTLLHRCMCREQYENGKGHKGGSKARGGPGLKQFRKGSGTARNNNRDARKVTMRSLRCVWFQRCLMLRCKEPVAERMG